MDYAQARPLDIGGTIAKAFALMARHPLKIFGVALLAYALPMRAVYYGLSILQLQGYPLYVTAWVPWIPALVLSVIVGGAVAGAIREEGSLGSTLRKLPQLTLAGLLVMLGCLLGMALLVIPYFFLVVRWCVVAAVTVNEDVSITGAFARSNALSKGVRLGIFGVALLSLIMQFAFSLLTMRVLIPILGGSTSSQDFAAVTGTVITLLTETAMAGFAASLQCSLYVHLHERLTEIFA